MSNKLYGIPNCDTVRKARKHLEAQGLVFDFVDVRKQALSAELLEAWCLSAGWEKVLNRRSTAWRGLSEDDKNAVDQSKAIALIQAHPTLMKRPILTTAQGLCVGFDAEAYAKLIKP